jgi:DNA-binding MarR family transcriptional regulator
MTAHFTDDYLGYLLGQANHAVYKDFDAQVKAAGLSGIEWRVLATLSDRQPLTVSELCREVLSQQPTMTKLVQRMQESGLVELFADAADQRRTRVGISKAGRASVKPLLAAAVHREAQVMKAMNAKDITALKGLLAKLATIGS